MLKLKPKTMIDIECEYCGAEYTAERSSAKYCSGSCRTLACRRRRKEEAFYLALQDLKAEGDAKIEFMFQQADLRLKELWRKSDAERDERDRIKEEKLVAARL